MGRELGIVVVIGLASLLAPCTAGAQRCPGDLNGDGTVTITEIITAVASALNGCAGLPACPGDLNGDGTVTINEIITAVANALNGCPTLPTPSPTGSASRSSATPTPSPTRTAPLTPAQTATLRPTAAGTPDATTSPRPTITPITTRTPRPTPTSTLAPSVTPSQSPTATPCVVDNGDGTIVDCATNLQWEKKDRAGGLHDANTPYTWAGLCADGVTLCQPTDAAAQACATQTGGAKGCALCVSGTCDVDPLGRGAVTTIWDWLMQLNAANFAGHNDWRIPFSAGSGGATTLPANAPAELESILADLPCPDPCVAPVFDTGCAAGCDVTNCSCTLGDYWSAASTNLIGQGASYAWHVYFSVGSVDGGGLKYGTPRHVRAVR